MIVNLIMIVNQIYVAVKVVVHRVQLHQMSVLQVKLLLSILRVTNARIMIILDYCTYHKFDTTTHTPILIGKIKKEFMKMLRGKKKETTDEDTSINIKLNYNLVSLIYINK